MPRSRAPRRGGGTGLGEGEEHRPPGRARPGRGHRRARDRAPRERAARPTRHEPHLRHQPRARGARRRHAPLRPPAGRQGPAQPAALRRHPPRDPPRDPAALRDARDARPDGRRRAPPGHHRRRLREAGPVAREPPRHGPRARRSSSSSTASRTRATWARSCAPPRRRAPTASLLPERHSAGLSETVARASAGALEHVEVARVGNLVQALEALKARGVWVVGFDAAGTERWDAVDLARPVALVLGGEGRGIRRLVREHCDHLVSIPHFGHVGVAQRLGGRRDRALRGGAPAARGAERRAADPVAARPGAAHHRPGARRRRRRTPARGRCRRRTRTTTTTTPDDGIDGRRPPVTHVDPHDDVAWGQGPTVLKPVGFDAGCGGRDGRRGTRAAAGRRVDAAPAAGGRAAPRPAAHAGSPTGPAARAGDPGARRKGRRRRRGRRDGRPAPAAAARPPRPESVGLGGRPSAGGERPAGRGPARPREARRRAARPVGAGRRRRRRGVAADAVDPALDLHGLDPFATLTVCRWRSSAVERLICNQRVGGSIPSASSSRRRSRAGGGRGAGDRARSGDTGGEVAKRSNASDCKSDGPRPSKVRILPSPPVAGTFRGESGREVGARRA